MEYATPDELKDRGPSMSLQLGAGDSSVDFDIPFTGKATLAGTVAATAPVIAAFLVLQRYFLQEHRAGGWLGR